MSNILQRRDLKDLRSLEVNRFVPNTAKQLTGLHVQRCKITAFFPIEDLLREENNCMLRSPTAVKSDSIYSDTYST